MQISYGEKNEKGLHIHNLAGKQTTCKNNSKMIKL